MNRSTTAVIAVATLMLGCGASGLMFVVPLRAEQAKLELERGQLASQNDTLTSQVRDLETKLRQLALNSISYFDLRAVPNQRRALEQKTVETLASLTEILNDNNIDVQSLEPKGESSGASKPGPAPGSSASTPPGSPSPAPAAASASAVPATGVSEPTFALTHKQFAFVVRGEYGNLVKTLKEFQGLPRAINVNQYQVDLLSADKKNATPAPDALPTSDSRLELHFQLSVSFLMSGGTPTVAGPGAESPASPAPAGSAAPGAPAPSSKPIGALMMDWALAWLGEPAYAAGLPSGGTAGARHARYEVAGVTSDGADLIVHTGRRAPRYHFSGTRTRLVIELEDTALAPKATFVGHAAGVHAVSMRPSGIPTGGVVIEVQTDGTQLRPVFDRGLRLRALGVNRPVARRQASLEPAPVNARGRVPVATPGLVEHLGPRDVSTPIRAVGTRVAATTPQPIARPLAAPPIDPTPVAFAGVVRAKAPSKARKHDAALPPSRLPHRTETADAQTWSTLAKRAAEEWAAREGRNAHAFAPPVGPDDRTNVARPVVWDQQVQRASRPLDAGVAPPPVEFNRPTGVPPAKAATVTKHEVTVASAATSALVTVSRENPATQEQPTAKSGAGRRPTGRPQTVAQQAAEQAARQLVRRRQAAARAAALEARQRAMARRARTRRMLALLAAKPAPLTAQSPSPSPTASTKREAGDASPKKAPSKPSPTPVALMSPGIAFPSSPPPTALAASPLAPSLMSNPISTYNFPLNRDKPAGRVNPFKPLGAPKGQLAKPVGTGPAMPPAPPKVPSVPGGTAGAGVPGIALPVPDALPKPAAAATGRYELGGVMVGGSGASLALVLIDGRPYTVGLNETLPGNARVTAIAVDHVILSADGRSVRLDLKR